MSGLRSPSGTPIERRHEAQPVYLIDVSAGDGLRTLVRGPLWDGVLNARENNISNHLARLRRAGLVLANRRGTDYRRLYCERDEAACAAALAQLRRLLEPST